ncbi:hypothetical protein DYB38_010602 [Aphanomyces astaci]|uniref:Uncharacterized protein n=1 Tax=Aphanomyces astaci TaxID=112090 RepID=A0A397DM24_APHAT|nr:hypothetical protein DYB36_006215 [Aphanomyces astaci]RHY63980.1 hypothetical protein DYB38_010602 [Aphanomyces astaci]RHZ22964.1 hypothetical protein DYB31_005132 [Aphanomyces astaci]
MKSPYHSMAPLHSFDPAELEDPNDNAHGAREHILFLDNILRVYKRNISNSPLNLAVEKFLFEQYRPVIHKFQKLMVGLKSLNNRVRLRKLTSLSPVLHNSTCCSSYHAKSVTMYVQRESLRIVHVRTLFDELIKDCPSMRTHLASAVSVVQSSAFSELWCSAPDLLNLQQSYDEYGEAADEDNDVQ